MIREIDSDLSTGDDHLGAERCSGHLTLRRTGRGGIHLMSGTWVPGADSTSTIEA